MSIAAPEPVDGASAAPEVPVEAVRLALELAFGVAVLGSRQRPPLPVPSGLRPFLRFQKLPPAALGPLRRAVEADEAFRARVASVADESVVGPAGSLWLRRPEGWEHALAQAVGAGAGEPDQAVARRARDDDARADRAERAAARAAAEAAVAHAALAGERERRAVADAERADLERQLAGVEAALTALTERVTAAERTAAAAERAREAAERRADAADAADATQERAVPSVEDIAGGPADERLDERIAERVAELEAQARAAEAGWSEARASLAEAQRRLAERPPAPPAARPPGDDLAGRLAPLVGDAAAAVADLAHVLDRLGHELRGRPGPGGHRPPAHRPPPHRRDASPGALAPAPVAPPVAPVPGPPAAAPRPARRPPEPGRTPVALPPRVRADSTEAAQLLLRRPGAVVLVDGYNVAKTAFPGARTLADERDWLGDVLDELAARHGGDLRVVFDGADVPPVPSRRRAVQVMFSPAGVTADDVLVDLANSLPRERPVVVVTNDLALRERVKVYGANVLAAEQLLAVARR